MNNNDNLNMSEILNIPGMGGHNNAGTRETNGRPNNLMINNGK